MLHNTHTMQTHLTDAFQLSSYESLTLIAHASHTIVALDKIVT